VAGLSRTGKRKDTVDHLLSDSEYLSADGSVVLGIGALERAQITPAR
jgi:hypothetical protein